MAHWFSLRPRLLILVLLAVLPAVALIIYTGVEERNEDSLSARAQTASYARVAAAHEQQATRFLRETLATLSQFDEILNESPTCPDRLRAVLANDANLTQLALIHADGSSSCSVPTAPSPLLLGSPGFRHAIETNSIAFGDYYTESGTGKIVLPIYYPMSDTRQPHSILAATIDLSWFDDLNTALPLPENAAIVLFDETGHVLAHSQAPSGLSGVAMPNSPLVENAVRGATSGELVGFDGTTRFYSIDTLAHPDSRRSFIAVGLPSSLVFGIGQSQFARNLTVTLLVTAAAMVVAWLFGDIFIIRRVSRLLAATQRLAKGEAPARTGMTYGLSELSQLARAFDQMAESVEQRVAERTQKIEQTNRELEAFTYSVSHDLRTPLSLVEGLAKMTLEDPHLDAPELQHQLSLIYENAREMQGLVTSLLNLSRASRQPLDKRTLDTGMLVKQVLDELLPLEGARQIDVSVGDLPKCEADPVLCKQVWMNLISNALKFTRPREAAQVEVGSGQWTVGSKPTDQYPLSTVYFVRDNGVGFDMSQSDKLFGVFQRLHEEGEFKGTGVGLALVRRIVQRHGGNIWAEAAPEKGATFYFTLGP